MPKIDGRKVQIIGPGRDRKIARPTYPLKNRLWPHTGPKKPGPGISTSGAMAGVLPVAAPAATFTACLGWRAESVDFTVGWTEVDTSNQLTITDSDTLQYIADGTPNPGIGPRFYDDLGVGFFTDKRLRLRFKTTCTGGVGAGHIVYHAFADNGDPLITVSDSILVSIQAYTTDSWTTQEIDVQVLEYVGGVLGGSTTVYTFSGVATTYSFWTEIEVYPDLARVYQRVYTDAFTTLVDEQTADIDTDNLADLRYWSMSTSTNIASGNNMGFVTDLVDLSECTGNLLLPFTDVAWIESDTDNTFFVRDDWELSIDYPVVTTNNPYMTFYADFGASYFNADQRIRFKFEAIYHDQDFSGTFWRIGFRNLVGPVYGDASDDLFFDLLVSDQSSGNDLCQCTLGSWSNPDSDFGIVQQTGPWPITIPGNAWFEIEIDATANTCTATMYSDAYTTVVATDTINILGGGFDFRYFYMNNSDAFSTYISAMTRIEYNIVDFEMIAT